MKIVWICHFTNDLIQQKLGISKKINEFAPWISLGIDEASKRNDIELHVISPHRWIKGVRRFSIGRVNFYFFNPGIPFLGRHWPDKFRFDVLTRFYFNRRTIAKLVDKINPDIIHLHGAENDYYSTSILDLVNKYPVILTIQGFLKRPEGAISHVLEKRIEYENQIISKVKHFGVRTDAMVNKIKNQNSEAIIHWHEYFVNAPDEISLLDENIEKEYDLIFFSRVTKEKGIEDFIEIVSRLSKTNNDLSAAVIGLYTESYYEKLIKLATDLGCKKNIRFMGFLKTQEDVFNILNKSKVYLLPTYNDTLPSTIMECMFRKIPVVSYITGGIPQINKEGDNIILVEQGNVDAMTNEVARLLENQAERTLIAEKAYQHAIKKWNNKFILDNIIKIYKKIV
ncbi:MAG: hypothetical protein SCALA702_33820 [Melioribacteraceae bacterium]|nr:MAG: hypothetical protein SCALA702_33820 [Melioribacteraceae bacterium]